MSAARRLAVSASDPVSDRGDHADRLARVVLALDPQLVELDEAGEADDHQEDDDEDRDQPAEERLGGEELLVGRAGEQPGMARNAGGVPAGRS